MSDKGLAEHYKVLKQFLVISDDSGTRAKSNSSRAIRAREKLLKLSGAQFRELSTDVYDELRRRIDESRGEPDYLLPKSTFHPKRNQARQKLSSLPQTRFKDLVLDISYEIERRNLHIVTASSESSWGHGDDRDGGDTREGALVDGEGGNGSSSSGSGSAATAAAAAAKEDMPKSNSSSDLLNQNIGVQAATVVPTKANLAWLSDDEDEELDDRNKDINTSSVNGESSPNKKSDRRNSAAVYELQEERQKQDRLIEELNGKVSTLEAEKQDWQQKYHALQQEHQNHLNKSADMSSEIQKLKEEKRASVISRQRSRLIGTGSLKGSPKEELPLRDEISNLKSTIATLRLENQSLKNTSSRDFSQLSKSNSFEKARSMGNGNANVDEIKKGIENFYTKLETLESPKAAKPADAKDLSVSEVSEWQKRYENLYANRAAQNLASKSFSKDSLTSFITKDGLLSIKLVSNLQALVDGFITNLNDSKLDADVLFDKISNISVIGNQLANQGDQHVLNSNAHSVCLRESISHALTATRYYAIYSKILPKVIVERSLDEVCFSVCDLVSVSKLKEGSVDSDDVDAKPTQNVSNKGAETSGKLDHGVSVRPLKMASKVREPGAGLGKNGSVLPDEKQVGSKDISNAAKIRSTSQSNMNSNSTPNPKDFSSPINSLQRDKEIEGRSSGPQTTKVLQKTPPRSSDSYGEVSRVDTKVTPSGLAGSLEKLRGANIPKKLDFTSNKKNISTIASKFQQNSNTSTPELSPGRSPKSGKEPGVAYLASKLKSSLDSNSKSPTSTESTPAKRSNIFEKVRQYETSSDESPTNRGLLGNSNDNKKNFSASDLESDSVGNTSFTVDRESLEVKQSPENNQAAFTTDSAKGKGLFKSIQDKFAASSTAAVKEEKPLDSAPKIGRGDDIKTKSSVSAVENGSKADGKLVQSSGLGLASQEKDLEKAGNSAPNVNQPGKALAFEEASTKKPDIAKKAKGVNFQDTGDNQEKAKTDVKSNTLTVSGPEEKEARQRQEYRKSMAAATFNVDLFDIDDPDNTLTQVLLYLEHQTVQVISTIQSLLSAIKKPSSTRGDLSEKSKAITEVISQMTEATNTSMNQTRNSQLKEHGSWVVKSLEDCNHRMNALCKPNLDKKDLDFADKNFKQRLAGISFDIAKCTKELVKTVEEASLKEDIANLDARLSQSDDLT